MGMHDVDQVHTSSRLIAATSSRIYDAWVRVEELVRWLPPNGAMAEIELFEARPGGRFKIILSFNGDTGKSSASTDVVLGQFLELVPGQKIVQAIDFASDRPEFAGTMTMSWSFQATGGKTLVSVVAADVPRGISRTEHEIGMASSLEKLAKFVESAPDS
jgi:uncharacterized protein YndB with AHSA1/START domain